MTKSLLPAALNSASAMSINVQQNLSDCLQVMGKLNEESEEVEISFINKVVTRHVEKICLSPSGCLFLSNYLDLLDSPIKSPISEPNTASTVIKALSSSHHKQGSKKPKTNYKANKYATKNNKSKPTTKQSTS